MMKQPHTQVVDAPKWSGVIDKSLEPLDHYAISMWSDMLHHDWEQRAAQARTIIKVTRVYPMTNPDVLRTMRELRDEVKTIRQLIESQLTVQDEPSNADMSVEDVKNLIVKECKRGEEYYPGAFALKHGLYYDTVVEALTSLQKEGRVEY